MVRISVLRNCPVICGEKRIGLLQSMTLDDARKRVHALIVSCGMRGKRMVPIECVSMISDGFILVSDVRKYVRSSETASSCFVRDTSGLLTGYVTDYALDERKNSILAVEIITGYSLREFRRRIWVYTYQRKSQGEDELIVPASLGSELIYSEEGNEICECPP